MTLVTIAWVRTLEQAQFLGHFGIELEIRVKLSSPLYIRYTVTTGSDELPFDAHAHDTLLFIIPQTLQ